MNKNKLFFLGSKAGAHTEVKRNLTEAFIDSLVGIFYFKKRKIFKMKV